MTQKQDTQTPEDVELKPNEAKVLELIEDADELTPKELQLECRAMAEELKKRRWMESSPAELTQRVPTSVFAMGTLGDVS